MTATQHGPRGEPIIQNPPTRIPDLTAIAEYAAQVGNHMADTASNRVAFTSHFGYPPYDGLTYFETDTGRTYLYYGAWNIRDQGWINYSPLFTNVARISAAGEYARAGGQVFFSGQATFLSGGNVGGIIRMSLPTDRHGYALPNGLVYAIDSSVPAGQGFYQMFPVLASANTIDLYWQAPANGALTATGSNSPFVWSNGDRILWDLRFPGD